jgi:hypothetical protein
MRAVGIHCGGGWGGKGGKRGRKRLKNGIKYPYDQY